MKKTASLTVVVLTAVTAAAIVLTLSDKKISAENFQNYATAFISELRRNKY